eukprot:Tbor_TRINITY_DN5444_c3_g3::TRINITY_DN5444_c3_g3_i1::g.24913::m.24913
MLNKKRRTSNPTEMQTVEWSSLDPRSSHPSVRIPYNTEDNTAIEKSYQKYGSSGKHKLNIMGMKFVINFSSMRQYNEAGGSRQVVRTVISNASVEEKVRAMLSKAGPHFTTSAASEALIEIDKMDLCTENIVKNIATYKHKYGPARSAPSIASAFETAKVNINPIVYFMNVLIDLFCIGEVGGHDSSDTYDLPNAPPIGCSVRRYFANISDGEIRTRKYLSLLGLRNLLQYGKSILSELHYQLYSDDRSKYHDEEGVYKMLYYTGNTVDLDTKVLDCNMQLKQLNQQFCNKFSDAGVLFNSQEATEMVYTSAKFLINSFIETMKLNDATIEKRAIKLPNRCPHHSEIPVETQSSNRGRFPIWGYMNVGVLTFHVNVPNLNDIMGAVLKAPFHLVKTFILIAQREGVIQTQPADVNNTNLQNFILEMKNFFSDGGAVSDSCFNGKWKAIEAYLDKVTMMDTIEQVLFRLQSENQNIFTRELFEMDDEVRTRETAEMVKLVELGNLWGKDPGTNTKRVISKMDVYAWIKATN